MKPLPLQKPCVSAWDDMRPIQEGRHCGSCDRVVYDLRRYSEAQVLALATLLAPTGLCARQIVDEDGNLVLAPQSPALRPRAVRWAGSTLAVLSVAGCAAATTNPARLPRAAAPPPAACAPQQTADVAPAPKGANALYGAQTRSGAAPHAGSFVKIGGIAPKVRDQIRFGSRSAKISSELQPLLTAIAEVLNRNPSIRRVTVVGHTAPEEGSGAPGKALGLRRAEAVRDALIALGVHPLRLTSESRGSEQPEPAAESSGVTSPDAHRRVEFIVCSGDSCGENPPG